MNENPDQKLAPEPDGKGRFPFSWKKIGEFITNTIRLERDVSGLKDKIKKLELQTNSMQRQLDEQTGQLKQLSSFVHTALHERVDSRAEQAAMNLVGRLMAYGTGPEAPALPKLPRAKKR